MVGRATFPDGQCSAGESRSADEKVYLPRKTIRIAHQCINSMPASHNRMVAGTAGPLYAACLLFAMGRADAAVHVENDYLRRMAVMNLVDPHPVHVARLRSRRWLRLRPMVEAGLSTIQPPQLPPSRRFPNWRATRSPGEPKSHPGFAMAISAAPCMLQLHDSYSESPSRRTEYRRTWEMPKTNPPFDFGSGKGTTGALSLTTPQFTCRGAATKAAVRAPCSELQCWNDRNADGVDGSCTHRRRDAP